MSKIVVIKPIQSNLINIQQVLRTDIEASNRGILALSSNGVLTLLAWIKKKILVKHIEDISDALWQKGGISELVAACHSGALFRYTLQQDTGLTKTLQLSAQSLLNLISSKDASIKSLKSLRIWGHTKKYILLQPQSDRLVLMTTNSSSRPSIVGIIKTPNLQSAHISGTTIIVQPCTGSDLYIHDASTCKTIEMVTLIVRRPGASYIQWDFLALSLSFSRIAVTDSERRLYVARFEEKKFNGKKNGIKTFHLSPRQIVWPAAFQPASLNQFILSLSENLLSVFCSAIKNEREEFYYFTYDTAEGGSLTFKYKFSKQVSLLPGLCHELPDLFLTDEGLCMLTDKECQVQNVSIAPDFESLLKSLEEALKEEDMEKISQIKAAVEEDLGIFLSSCNHMEGWVDKVETRSRQHAHLVDTLLSHLTKSASDSVHRPSLLGLKELAKHHFKTLQDEMSNVLKYVDAEKVSQMLLVMVEQMNFYLRSVEAMKLPEGTQEDKVLIQKFEIWGDRPVKEILSEALSNHCVRVAETYLSMKPWIYGPVESSFIVSTCVDIVRDGCGKLLNMGEPYKEDLKTKLFSSKDLREIQLLEEVLVTWEALSERESVALYLIQYIHRLSPHMIFKYPKFWGGLVMYEEAFTGLQERELTIAEVLRWTVVSVNLVLLDLYARVEDADILNHVEISSLWRYLLIRRDQTQLLRWINFQMGVNDSVPETNELRPKDAFVTRDLSKDPTLNKPQGTKNLENKLIHRSRWAKESLLGGQMYCSDSESLYSFDSSVLEGADEVLRNISESSTESLSCYLVTNWPADAFVFLTQTMVDEVQIAPFDLKESLLDTFAQFGIFVSSEKGKAQKMIRRLIKINSLLSFKPTNKEYPHKIVKSVLDKLVLESFMSQDLKSCFYEYISANNLNSSFIAFEAIQTKPWSAMVAHFQALEKSQAKEIIYDLCLETLRYFSSTKENFCEDYLAIFLTMLHAPHATLSDFLADEHVNKESSLVFNDVEALNEILLRHNLKPKDVLEKLASDQMPHLRPLMQKSVCLDKIDISVYDLLRGSIPFDIGSLFTWQKFNKYGYSEGNKPPSFSDEALSAKEGIKCSLDYYYYLKAGRPTYALASILLSMYSPEDTQQLQSKELSVFGLALSSWPDKRVCSACVALLFIAQLNYETLRTILFTADLIIETLEHQETRSKVQENLVKSQLNLLTQEVKGFLFRLTSLSMRTEAATSLILYLEDAVIARVQGKSLTIGEYASYYGEVRDKEASKVDFSSKEHLYYILMGLKLSRELSSLYNLPPPQRIMKFLAKEDQWLLFLVAAQLFAYPQDVVGKACSHFASQPLQDHVKFCVDGNKRRTMDESSIRELQREEDDAKSDPDDDPIIKGKGSYSGQALGSDGMHLSFKNKRKVRRKKLRTLSSADNKKSSVAIGSDCSRIPMVGSMEVSLSVTENASFNLRANGIPQPTSGLAQLKWESDTKPLDIFAVVLRCHKQEKPAIELMEACLIFRSPILAVIASCYDPSLKDECISLWLYSYIPVKLFDIVKSNSQSSADIQSKALLQDILHPDYLKKLIAFYLYCEFTDVLTEGMNVFYEKCLVLPVIQALECAKMGNSIEDISKILSRLISDFSQRTLSESDNKSTELCISTLCQGLDLYLKNRSLQKIFLKSFLPFTDMFPFNTKQICWKNILEVLNILDSTNLPWRIFSEELMEEKVFNLVIKKVVKYLIDIEEYEKAFKAASLLSLDTSDIFCCQLESEFEVMKKNNTLKPDSATLFLLDSYAKMVEKEVPRPKMSLFYETIAVNSGGSFYSYLAYQFAVVVSHKEQTVNEDETLEKGEEAEEKSESEQLKLKELLEFKMWSSYVEAKLEKSLTGAHGSVNPPELFGSWPWERNTFKAKYLNDTDVEQESVVHFGMKSADTDFDTELKKLRTAFDGNPNEEKKDFLQNEVASLIKELLRNDLLVTACRVEQLFGVEDQDVAILKQLLKKSCSFMGSPCDSPSPHSSSPVPEHSSGDSKGVRVLSPRRPPIKKRASLNLRPGHLTRWISVKHRENDWLGDIKKLTLSLSSSYHFAKRILMLCRLADELMIAYLNIITAKDPIQILKEILCYGTGDGLSLAKDLIEALPIPSADVNNFLFDQVFAIISAGPSPSEDEDPSAILDWKSLDHKWIELLALTEAPSAIGLRLMDVYGTLVKDTHPDHVAKAQMMSVEVIIRAHDCFSLAANMEGINQVLQAAPALTKALLKHKQWPLMGRLLTGIKRYKEMSYILDVMRDNQQFERLLGGSSENKHSKILSSGLDKTLLHFLHSNYPEDKDMLRMVALHFLMFSELAKMWAEEAMSIIRRVMEGSLHTKSVEEPQNERSSLGLFFMKRSDVEDTASLSGRDSVACDRSSTLHIDYLKSADVNLLIEAMNCYCYAAQYCVQEKQLMSAMRYSRQAELIAVQLSLIKAANDELALRVISLSPALLNIVLTEHLCVREVILVSRAYGVAADWSASLYCHFIQNGDKKFLEDFLQFAYLTPDIAMGIVKNIEKHGLRPEHKERMAKILAYVGDLDVVYKIASQLDLRSKVEECLDSKSACYLKDTVFNRGVAGSGRV